VIRNNGVWDCQSDATLQFAFGGGANFYNAASATFRKSAGAGTTTVASRSTIPEPRASRPGPSPSTTEGRAPARSRARREPRCASAEAPTISARRRASTRTPWCSARGPSTWTGGYDRRGPARRVQRRHRQLRSPRHRVRDRQLARHLLRNGELLERRGDQPVDAHPVGRDAPGNRHGHRVGRDHLDGRDDDGAGTTNANGGIAFGGANVKDLSSSRVLNTSGTTTWTGTGAIRMGRARDPQQRRLGLPERRDAAIRLRRQRQLRQYGERQLQEVGRRGHDTVDVAFGNSGSVQALSGTTRFTGGFTQTAGSRLSTEARSLLRRR